MFSDSRERSILDICAIACESRLNIFGSDTCPKRIYLALCLRLFRGAARELWWLRGGAKATECASSEAWGETDDCVVVISPPKFVAPDDMGEMDDCEVASTPVSVCAAEDSGEM